MCDENCNTHDCSWDYGDCAVRRLSSPDCSRVSENSPFQVFVSDNPPSSTQFSSLVEALVNGVYCSYNQIILLKNTEVNEDLGSSIAVGGADNSNILVTSIKSETFTVFVQQALQIQVQGNLKFSNIIFEYEQIGSEGSSLFTVCNNAILAFDQVAFQGFLNEIARVEYGKFSVSGSRFSGIISSPSVFSTSQCEIFCEIGFSSTDFSDINFQKSQLLIAKNARVSASNTRITKASSNSVLFTLLYCEISLELLTMDSSNITGLMMIYGSPVFQMQDSHFSDIILETNLLQFKHTEICNLVNSTFLGITVEGFIIEFTATIAAVHRSVFTNCNASAIFSDSDSSLEIHSSEISNDFSGTKTKVLGVYSRNSLLEITNTRFVGQSPGINIEGYSECSVNIIENSCFENCTSESGGAVSVTNADISLISNVFKKNIANYGGAVYILAPHSEKFNISVQHNSFSNNQATGGGGVFLEDTVIELSTNTFSGNTGQYGNDKATPGANLLISKKLEKMYPGNQAPDCLEIVIKDYYNQTVINTNYILVGLSLISSNKNSSLSGIYVLTPVEGVYSFCNLIIYGRPDSTITLRATVYGGSTLQSVPFIDMPIYLDPCSPGEVTTDSLNSCQPCLVGQYSFGNNETACRNCPENANCLGNTVNPIQGYWHSNLTSVEIHVCINPDICVNNDQGACKTGYTGNLCAVCAEGYTSTSSNTCQKCPSLSKNIPLVTFISILIILFVCYAIYRAYEDAYELKLYHSVLLKILMNYIQLMLVTTDIKMKWPEPLNQLIQAQEDMSSGTSHLFSLDCLMQRSTNAKPFYASIIINFLAPVIIFLLIFVVWGIVALVKKSFSVVVRPFITSLVVVFFLMHPIISNASLSILNCYQINSGEYWNVNSFDIQCYTEGYQNDYYAMLILGILLWTIGLPVLAYILL